MNKINNKIKKILIVSMFFVFIFSLFSSPKAVDAYGSPYVPGGYNYNYTNQPTTPTEQKPETVSCVNHLGDGKDGWFDVKGCIGIALYYVLLKPASLVLWLAGMIFNITINFTLNFGAILNDPSMGLGSGNNGVIYIGWSTIRNFVNVAFIFVLLYVSIATILQLDGYNAKKMITKIVLAALLLNFSLFFTKAIIDLSNLLALQFYSRILEASTKATGNPASANQLDGGISLGLLNALGFKSIWGGGDQKNGFAADAGAFAANAKIDSYGLIILSLLGSVFMIVFAFILIIATIQFLIRSLILIILMLTSAVGFLGGSVPGLESTSKDWWAKLKENAIFAPAYMAMLYMVCQIIFGVKNAQFTGGEGYIGISKGSSSNVGLLFWFALVIGLLLSAQIVAGRFASKFGSGMTKKAGDLMKNGGKWVGKKYWGATGGAAIKGAGIAGRKLGTSALGGALLTKTPLSRIGGQKVFDNLAAKEVEVAKEKAKNLRRRSGESDTSYEGRQNAIRSKAMAKQAIGFGLDTSHFDYDNGKMTLNAEGKKAIKARKIAAQTRFSKFARKSGDNAAERISSAYADPKKGSEDDVKIVVKTLEKSLEKEKDAVYDQLAERYERAVKGLNTQVEQDLLNGNFNQNNVDALKAAKKVLAEHTEPVRKLERALADAKEKLEKVKSADKEKAGKDSKGGKK